MALTETILCRKLGISERFLRMPGASMAISKRHFINNKTKLITCLNCKEYYYPLYLPGPWKDIAGMANNHANKQGFCTDQCYTEKHGLSVMELLHPAIKNNVEFDENGLSEDEINFIRSPAFYHSTEWKLARYRALSLHGAKCQCCGATRWDGVKIHVDHIKPRSRYPQLALDVTNLQVLCDQCNIGKGKLYEDDWRKET